MVRILVDDMLRGLPDLLKKDRSFCTFNKNITVEYHSFFIKWNKNLLVFYYHLRCSLTEKSRGSSVNYSRVHYSG